MPSDLIIIGASARAAADSAHRAGLTPCAIDLFGDRDLVSRTKAQICPPGDYPLSIPRMLQIFISAPATGFVRHAPVLFTGALENHPQIIEAVATKHPLLGSSPQSIRAARDPFAVTQLLYESRRAGLHSLIHPVPVYTDKNVSQILPEQDGRNLVRKSLRSAAGIGITILRHSDAIREFKSQTHIAVPPTHYYQPLISGQPISAQYHSDKFLGATLQIISDPAFGATHFGQYIGNLGPFHLNPQQQAALESLGQILVSRLGLSGLFGVDLIADPQGHFYVLEINPRYTAAMEILEAATGHAFLSHAFQNRTQESLRPPGPPDLIHGKAIVYARQTVCVPDLYEIFDPKVIADVPWKGDVILSGRPICTLRAASKTAAVALAELHDMAGYLYTRLQP